MNTLSLVHAHLRSWIHSGDFVIDATAGNGKDTEFLCGLVGREGKVLAFDIQEQAVENTKKRLEEHGWSEVGEVVLDSHANMGAYAQENSVDCIVFNFGRLPGGDPHIFTRAESSVAAIEAGLRLLKPGGVMAIALYYGKENGYEERDAVLAYLRGLDDRCFSVLCCDWANRRNDPPMPIFIWKER